MSSDLEDFHRFVQMEVNKLLTHQFSSLKSQRTHYFDMWNGIVFKARQFMDDKQQLLDFLNGAHPHGQLADSTAMTVEVLWDLQEGNMQQW